MGWLELCVLVLVVVVSGAAQGVTGFGFAIVASPLLSLFLPVKDAIPVVLVVSLLLSLAQFSLRRPDVDVPAASRLVLASLAGMPVGLVLFLVARPSVLQLGVGCCVLVAVLIARRRSWPAASGWVILVAGFVSGVLKTSVSVNGPPVALALQLSGLSARSFRATMAVVLFAGNLVSVVAFAAVGAFSRVPLSLLVGCCVVASVGALVGHRLAGRLPEAAFEGVVLCLVVLSGCLCLLLGLRGVLS